jgi:dihydroceramidase
MYRLLIILFFIDFISNMLYWIYNYNKASSIDWCEENYIITGYIAEYYNTLSMIPGVILLTYGFIKSINIRYNYHIIISYLLSFWLSIGSFMFHARLTKFWQAQDELPMLYLGIWSFFCVMKLYKINYIYDYETFIVICIFITRYYVNSSEYIEFIVPYSIITVTSLLSFLYHILYIGNSKNIGLLGIISIIIGFIFWLIDLFFCSLLKFHAIWHLCIGITQYSLIKYVDLEI